MTLSGQNRRELSADPRVMRTRALLKQALMQMLQQMNWEEITIVGICRRAGIARSSFYEHFGTKADVLDQIFADRMDDIPLSVRSGDPLGTLDWLVDHVAEAPEFFAHAMAGGRNDALMPRFRIALARKLAEELTARAVPDASGMAAFLVGGAMAYLATARGDDARSALRQLSARLIA